MDGLSIMWFIFMQPNTPLFTLPALMLRVQSPSAATLSVCLILCTFVCLNSTCPLSLSIITVAKTHNSVRMIPQLQLPNNENVSSVFFSDYNAQRENSELVKKLLMNQKQTTLTISQVRASTSQASCNLHACPGSYSYISSRAEPFFSMGWLIYWLVIVYF